MGRVAACKPTGSCAGRPATAMLGQRYGHEGSVGCYGLGRSPGTLYKRQWTTLLDMADDIRAFIRANEASRNTKS